MWTLILAYGIIAAEARLVDANLRKGCDRIVQVDNRELSANITLNSIESGVNIRLYKKMNTSVQVFRIAPKGDGTYVISGYNSGKFFDCANAKARTNICQGCSGNTACKRWYILNDTETGKYVIRSKNGSHVVMIAEGVESGVNVGRGSYDGKSSQYWTRKQVCGSSIYVEPNGKSLSFDVVRDVAKNGVNVRVATSVNSARQM